MYEDEDDEDVSDFVGEGVGGLMKKCVSSSSAHDMFSSSNSGERGTAADGRSVDDERPDDTLAMVGERAVWV